VKNLSRPSQRRVSSAKKRTARRFLVWSFCGVDESVERRLLAGRYRQSAAQSASVRQSLAIAVAVVIGALTWGVVLCTALKFGAHIFSHPNWQVATEAITAAVMLWFAIRLLLHFP